MKTEKNKHTFNFTEREISFSKSFLKRANNINSKEHNELMRIWKKHPDFKIVEKPIESKAKDNNVSPSYEHMKKVINTIEGENSTILITLKKIIDISKAHKHPYSCVKKWFKEQYEHYKDFNVLLEKVMKENNEKTVYEYSTNAKNEENIKPFEIERSVS